MARSRSGRAALSTPLLLASAATLRHDLAAAVERSRDLRWWGHRRRQGLPTVVRPIGGGADHAEDTAVVLTMILGSALCLDCMARKSGVPVAQVDAIITTISGTVTLIAGPGRCDACLEATRTFRIDSEIPASRVDEGTRRRVTQHAILGFLGEQAGKVFCADCISTRLFGGKNIDVAMRHLEGNGVSRRHGVCSSCGKRRLVAGRPPS